MGSDINTDKTGSNRSVRRQKFRAVLEHSIRVSATEDSGSMEGVLKRNMTAPSEGSSDSRCVARFRKSLHHETVIKDLLADGKSNDTFPPPLAKSVSFESFASTASSDSTKGTCSPPSTRTIFKRYWEVTKEQKAVLSRATPSPPPPPPNFAESVSFEESPCDNKADATPQTSEPMLTLKSIPAARRRSIFDSESKPLPPLERSHSAAARTVPPRPHLRKTSSTSVLLTKRQSCLRNVQSYSSGLGGAVSVERRNRAVSVSFCPQVDVYEFQKPREVHAQEGWNKFFA